MTSSSRAGCRFSAALLVLALCLLAIATPARAREPAAPQTAPAAWELDYSPAEQAVLSTVRDGDGGSISAALFLLLNRSMTRPAPAPAAEELPRASYRELLARPSDWRGRAISGKVRVCLVHTLTVGNGYLPRSPHWP